MVLIIVFIITPLTNVYHKQAKLASMRNCTGDKTCITVYVTICYRKDKVGLEIFVLCAFLITIAVFYLIPY